MEKSDKESTNDSKNDESQKELKPVMNHSDDHEPNKESDTNSDSQNNSTDPKFSDSHNYELIDNVYYYTDKTSNTRFMYDQDKVDWVECSSSSDSKENEASKVVTDEEGRQYYWAQGMYLCRDAHGNNFYMDENKDWKPWLHSRETNDNNRWYFYKGKDTYYRDNTSNLIYKLNKEKNEWEEYRKKKKRKSNEIEEFDTDDEEGNESSDEEDNDGLAPPGSQTDPSISYDGNMYTKYDAKDNMTYEWDSNRRAWFPKLDEDFMATYQLSYGFNPDGTKNENPLKYDDDEEEENEEQENKKNKKKIKETKGDKQKPGWFDVDDAHNKNVYVSNLPSDTTEDSFVEFMSKCGLVYKDPNTQKFKIKLYHDKDGTFKGDARCTYIKVESVDLALQILDGYRLGNNTVCVERAQFTQKGEYNPSLKPKKKRKKDMEKMQKKQEKLFDWRPDPLRGQRMKHENVVIFRNVFDPKEFETAAEKILTHKEAIKGQAETFGQIKKIELFDRHPEGVVKVTFIEVESADMCVATLNNRLYAKRKLFVATWDGVEKFAIEETEEQRQERIKKWEEFLEGNQSLS